MIEKKLADKLTKIAVKQLEAGKKLKKGRMRVVREIEDLYNNKIVPLGDGRINIPFPIMAGYIDTLFSKIDNPPSCTFKIPNHPILSEKSASAWKMDTTSMKSAWQRKDREEKKFALFSGRGICSVFASSVDNKYKSHYNVIDHLSFVCEGTKGHLEDMMYCGEEGIWKTETTLKNLAAKGVYDKAQVDTLLSGGSSEEKSEDEQRDKYDRMEALGLTPDKNAYVGQKVYSLVQWYMEYEGTRYCLLFDPKSVLWIRAEKLKDVFKNNKYPYVSWATNGGNAATFWDKGPADDVLPVAEAMRIILNETLENARRRNRPMRIVQGGDFPDVNEIMDYLPDNVIVTNSGRKGEIYTIETPELSASINLVEFINAFIGEKTGISGQGVDEKDAKVGVYYGQLQQEADRVGITNKAYEESYAEKGYRWWWGLKEHLNEEKAIEMLGKSGIVWDTLQKIDFEDVDDVDDVIVSGGQREEQSNAVLQKQQSETLTALTATPVTLQELSPRWIIRIMLKTAGFSDEDIQKALDKESDPNRQIIQEADEAIQEIMVGKTPSQNRGANIAFMQRILDWDIENLNWVKLDKKGQQIGIDKKKYDIHVRLMSYLSAHQQIVIQNQQREIMSAQATAGMGLGQASGGAIRPPVPTENDQRMSLAQPFENPQGTPEGTAQVSQEVSNVNSPSY